MELEYINFEIQDGIGWVQFNRPEKMNALNPRVLEDLELVVGHCEQNEEIKVFVLKGNETAFIAGADIEEMAVGDVKFACRSTDLAMRVQERLADLAKPTIAAVAGYALGGGCEMALCCDFRIAADNAVFGVPEITLGLIPGGGGTQRLTRLVGLGAATKLLFLGEMINAEEAEKIGLVHEVVSKDTLESKTKALASKLMERPALALRAIKTAMRKGLSMSLKEGLNIEQQTFCMLFGTEDRKEGLTAFMEKRKPVFKGR